MGNNKINKIEQSFENFAVLVTRYSGSTPAFIIAISLLIVWCISGPFFNFSQGWQVIINTITTIIIFLMVFVIQRAQNKDSLAIQMKLNELIAASPHASNRLVDAEDISENELQILKLHYKKLAAIFENDSNINKSYTIEDA